MKQYTQYKNLLTLIKEATCKNQKQVLIFKYGYNLKALLMQLRLKGFIKNFVESGNYIIIKLKQPYIINSREKRKPFLYFETAYRFNQFIKNYKNMVHCNMAQEGEYGIAVYDTKKCVMTYHNVSRVKMSGIPYLYIV